MKAAIASLMSAVLLLIAYVGTADAKTRGNKQRHNDSYARKYPSATPRQLKNLRAYERGDYYEHLSSALPVGSKPWFEEKERESGDHR